MIARIFRLYFDLILSASAALVGAFIIYLSVVFGIHQYGVGSVLLFTGLIYLAFRKRLTDEPATVSWSIGGSLKILNNIVFVIVLSSSIWLLHSTLYVRPLIYFLLSCVAVLSVCFEIFYTKEHSETWLIILKIFLMGITIRAGLYFEFPSIYGVDPWFHQYLIQDYIKVGQIPPSARDYGIFPVFHLLIATTQLVTGADTRLAYFLTLGLIQVISVIFVFLIGRSVFNRTTGLLASVFVVISDYWVLWGVWIIPQTLGLVFTLIILYTVLALKRNHQFLSSFLFITFSVVLILTHSLAALIALVTIFAIFLTANALYKNRQFVSGSALLFLFISTLSYWMWSGVQNQRPFLDGILLSLRKTLLLGTEFADPSRVSIQLAPNLQDYLNQMGHLSLLGLGLLGAFVLASERRRSVTHMCLVLMMILLYVIAYTFPLFGLKNIISTRWFAVIYIPVALMGAFALVHTIGLFKSSKLQVLMLAVLVALNSFFMTTNTKVNPDNPIYAKEYAQVMGRQESEVAAAGTIAALLGRQSLTEDRPILATDADYGLLIDYNYSQRIGVADLFPQPSLYNIIVLREYAFTGRFSVTLGEQTDLRIPYRLDKTFLARFNNEEYNKVYDNQKVWVYVKRPR